MMMSSRYPMAKSFPVRTILINFINYAGAWAKPNGTLLNWYLPTFEMTKAVLGMALSERPIW